MHLLIRIVALACLSGLLTAIPAAAEDWQLLSTYVGPPLNSITITGINNAGTIVGLQGGSAFRRTLTGQVDILGTTPGCTYSVVGIANDGSAAGLESCGGTRAAVWTPGGTAAITSAFPNDSRIQKIAPDGRFVGTSSQSTASPSAFSGQVNAGVAGMLNRGAGRALGVANDIGALWQDHGQFYMDGLPFGLIAPFNNEATNSTGWLLPDRTVITEEPDPAPTGPGRALHLHASGNAFVPLPVATPAGTAVNPAPAKLISGWTNPLAFLGTGVGGPGVLSGQTAIVAYTAPITGPESIRLLPIFHPTADEVVPVAVSGNGRYIVLSDREIWRDVSVREDDCLDGTLAPPGSPLPCVPRGPVSAALKDQARQQQKINNDIVRESPLNKAMAESVLLQAGVGVKDLKAAVQAAGGSLSNSYIYAFQAQLYWQYVINDPPDPNFKTPATAPPVNGAKIKAVRALSKKENAALKAYLLATSQLGAQQSCDATAVNRAATAVDANDGASAIAQYRAAATCANAGAALAATLPKLAKAAGGALKKLNKAVSAGAKKGYTKPSKAKIKAAITAQVKAMQAVTPLSADAQAALRAALTPKAKSKARLADLSKLAAASAKRAAGSADELRATAAAFTAGAGGVAASPK
jgi:hypothetical protein